MATYNLADALQSYTKSRALLMETPEQMGEMLAYFLRNIQQGKELNAFVRLYEEEAKALVPKVISDFAKKTPAKLSGLVVGLKDLFCYKDHPIQGGSRILEGFTSKITATAVQKLIDAGAIILGHQNCDEFGMGSANENSTYGFVRNPINPNRSAGGSSGGSAAAIAAVQAHVSLGTDTGGSVRQPAAFCGLIGFKPTYGRISRYGVIAYASSYDTVGILSHTVEDCAAVLQVVAGEDQKDNTSSRRPVPNYLAELPWKKKQVKVCYLKETLAHPALQKEIKQATEATLDRLKKAGHQVTAVDFSLLSTALPVYYTLTAAESTANLARYDGVRFGHRATGGATSFKEMVRKTRTEGFGREVKRRLLLGAFVLSSNYSDSYYVRAQRVRSKIKLALEELLKEYDYIICPTTPTTAFAHHSTDLDPISQYLADMYTILASTAGVPAISIPNGLDKTGLPIGLQVIGKAFQEAELLSFSQYLLDLRKEKD